MPQRTTPLIRPVFVLAPLALVIALAGCNRPAGEPTPPTNTATADADSGGDSDSGDGAINCETIPDFPGCGPDLRPGFAKFTLGSAKAVRWSGVDGCVRFDYRTGRHGKDEKLTKVAGEVTRSCNDHVSHFEFVYRQRSGLPKPSWTTAYRPLNDRAAERLLDSCTSDTRPNKSVAVGHWWEANNTYAENALLRIIAPLAYASALIPFDDDGYEQVGEETLDGVQTVHFRNEQASVWLIAGDNRDRPVRATDTKGATDVRFTEWDVPFAARIPEGLRQLEDICSRQ